MRAVIQRAKSASVTINDEVVGKITNGVVVFLGIKGTDTEKDIQWIGDKVIHLRIFEDENGKMNKSLAETHGEMLIVSQFTLYGDCRKGRRPGYSTAARPEIAEPLYEAFISYVANKNITVATGKFQEDMDVALINDGPVTLLIDSEKTF